MQLNRMHVVFAREMQRARWSCVSVALAFIVVAEGIYINAFLEANFYALAAAYKIMQIAAGAACASAIMWLAFIVIRPSRKKVPGPGLAKGWRFVIGTTVWIVSLGAFAPGFVAIAVELMYFDSIRDVLLREAVSGRPISVTLLALGSCFATFAHAAIMNA